MMKIYEMAKSQADEFAVRDILVASNSGRSALEARKALGDEFNIIAVGNPTASHAKGLVAHSGITEEVTRRLQENGIKVVLHPQSIFQKHAAALARKTLRELSEQCRQEPLLVEGIVYDTLQLFGSGPRVCIEIAIMAADQNALPLRTNVISIARPSLWCEMPDASMVLAIDKTDQMFMGKLRVKDLRLHKESGEAWFSDKDLPW